MLIVGLTGGIATGKTVVANILREKGCYVDNADLLAQDLMQPGGKLSWLWSIILVRKYWLQMDK